MVCGGAMTEWPPRVLSNLYRTRLQTFYELLAGLITNSLHFIDEECGVGVGGGPGDGDRRLRKQAEERLIGDGDPAEYVALLKRSYVVMAETAPTLGHVSFEQRWTQEQIVERVIVLQFQQEDKPSHVLCAGYRKLRPSAGETYLRRSPHGLECACDNSSVDIVNSSSWKILLSRVGDLIMLHVLTHAAVFSPLPNNCFLQVAGAPTSSVASTPGKPSSIHPGEKMLGGVALKKRSSESHAIKSKRIGRHLHISGVEDEEGKQQPNSNAEPPAADSTSIELKQAYAGKGEFAGENGTGLVRDHTSTLSPSLKRRRIERAETGLKMDIAAKHCKDHDIREGKISRKRRRCGGSTDQICHNGRDGSNDAVSEPARSSPNHTPAKSLRTGIENLCSRKVSEGTSVQNSGCDRRQLNGDGNSPSNNSRKRRKLTERTGKDTGSQQRNEMVRVPGQASPHSTEPQLLKRGRISKKAAESSGQLGGSVHKHEKVPASLSTHGRGDRPVVQDACASQSQGQTTVGSGKRVRLPSWKRRKLRQAQEPREEVAYKDLPLQSCGDGRSGVAKQVDICPVSKLVANVEEVMTKTRPEISHLSPSGVNRFQPSDETDVGCSSPCEEIAAEKGCGSQAPPENRPQRKKKSSYGLGAAATHGVPERLIDRAPIFYNSNYSCHPGLPAKHILNTARPNEPGVARLFSAIFGARCDVPVCSSSGGRHMYANCSRSKLKPGQSSRFKSVHSLLHKLLSNARRCAFARLLGRHCPLPEGFRSTRKDSPAVAAAAAAAPLPQFETPNPKTVHKGSDLDVHEDVRKEFQSPDGVEVIMSLWLGPNYQPRQLRTRQPSEVNTTNPSETAQEEGAESSSVAQKPTEELEQDIALESALDDDPRREKNKQAELISCYTAHEQVVAFLWAVCRSIVPQDMLGCVRSWRALRSSIAHFVGLRRHEKFNVKHALFKLPLSGFPWLAFQCAEQNSAHAPPQTLSGLRESQQRRLELWLYWLFSSLIVPLIRAHFYVTENENYRQNIFYYRKPVWARVRANGVRELTSKNYQKLSKNAVAEALNSRALGFSQIRLLPKRTGLRPIANLAAASQGTLKFSVRSKAKITLSQVFGTLSRELSSTDCYPTGDVSSLAHQSAPPVVGEVPQCSGLESHEASSSWSPGSGKRSRSLAALGSSSGVQKRSKKSVNFSFRSINSALRDLYCCLKLEKEAHPRDLGSSVFGYCDVHKRILPFIMQMKESPHGIPQLFFAVCDVTKAYDTIPQDKLREIVEGFVQSPNYKVARYSRVTPTLASVRVSYGRACTLGDDPGKFVDSVRDLAAKRSHCVFVDQAFSTSVRRDQILAVLGEHVKENIVQIGAHFYQQKVGIPQGSILSSLLCSLFYGHFEATSLLPAVQSQTTETSSSCCLDLGSTFRERDGRSNNAESGPCLMASSVAKAADVHDDDIEQMLELSLEISDEGREEEEANSEIGGLSQLFQDNRRTCSCLRCCPEAGTCSGRDSVLLRLIDDSLFISTSEGGAKVFVESMHRGSKEYGCHANQRKTATSFCLQLGDEVLPRKVYQSEDGACFMRWSGLLVNCFTLEFQADYTRYCGEHIRSSLTVRREQNQGLQLVLKMCQYMRPKCHVLFFDPRINSPATIRLNAFQAFLLCAMKVHAYVCCLPHVTGINEPFLFKAIDCAIRYKYGLLRHKMASVVGAEAEAYFPYKELEWLGLAAFYRVLKRKQARYQTLLRMLQTQLQMPQYNKLTACPHLSSATDERRSSMFKYIKY